LNVITRLQPPKVASVWVYGVVGQTPAWADGTVTGAARIAAPAKIVPERRRFESFT